MYCLGQTVSYRSLKTDPWVSAVITGFSTSGMPQLSILTENGELEKDKIAFLSEISYLRQLDKTSPSGKSIYYGSMYRKGVGGKNIRLAKVDENLLIKELKKTLKLLPNINNGK